MPKSTGAIGINLRIDRVRLNRGKTSSYKFSSKTLKRFVHRNGGNWLV